MKNWLPALALVLALPVSPVHAADTASADHPEARPFAEDADTQQALAGALQAAAVDGRNLIVIMGANWCHDSRALAGWFTTPHFAQMLARQYHVVYIDVGNPQMGKGRNLEIAKRFGIKKVKGTPLVMLVSPDGMLLNSKKDAASWRNSASRSENDIFRYFSEFNRSTK